MSGEAPNPPPPKARKKSGVVVPHSARWYQRLAAFLIWLAVSAVSVTIRYRLHDPQGLLQRKNMKQALFCFWHNRLALCVKVYHRYRRADTAPGIAALVSASKDGALLSAIFARFGIEPVRGSSSRRGAQALMELTTWAERGYDLAITPDGPRGPCYVMAEGPITLAQVTGLPLVTGSFHIGWKFSLNSWDKFQIPLPFSRCDIYISKAFQVPRELTDVEREKIRGEVEAELRAITRD